MYNEDEVQVVLQSETQVYEKKLIEAFGCGGNCKETVGCKRNSKIVDG